MGEGMRKVDGKGSGVGGGMKDGGWGGRAAGKNDGGWGRGGVGKKDGGVPLTKKAEVCGWSLEIKGLGVRG